MDLSAKIGIINETGTIVSVNCCLNGGIDNTGLLLYNYYNDIELISKLVKYGAVYQLKKYIDKGIFNKNESREETTIFDIRDRNYPISLRKSITNRNINGFISSCKEVDAKYGYLFDKENNEWICYDLVNNESFRLEDKLRELGYITEEKEGHKSL